MLSLLTSGMDFMPALSRYILHSCSVGLYVFRSWPRELHIGIKDKFIGTSRLAVGRERNMSINFGL
jgi:hypothetical protein